MHLYIFVLCSVVSIVLGIAIPSQNDEKRHSFKIQNETKDNVKLIDGDMIMPHKYDNHKRKKRMVFNEVAYKWPTGIIPIVFDTEYPVDEIYHNLTNQAIQQFSEQTCIKIINRTNETSYVNITAKDAGCFAGVGNIDGPQVINLAPECNTVGVVVHEFMHVLGFLHEHNRPDRDTYIYVNFSNIEQGAKTSFKKHNVTVEGAYTYQGIPYDKKSVMHYDNFAGSMHDPLGNIKERMSMYSISDPTESLGNNNGLASSDAQRVNLWYGCPNTTTTTPSTTSSTNTNSTITTSSLSANTTSTTPSNAPNATSTLPTNPTNSTQSNATTSATSPTSTTSTSTTLTVATSSPSTNSTTNSSMTTVASGNVSTTNGTWGLGNAGSINAVNAFSIAALTMITMAVYSCF